MTGLDGDVMARAVKIDVVPLSALGEVVALLAGRETFSLSWIAGRGRYEIDVRYCEEIRGIPPGSTVNADVVAAHRCGAPALPRLMTGIPSRVADQAATNDPPF